MFLLRIVRRSKRGRQVYAFRHLEDRRCSIPPPTVVVPYDLMARLLLRVETLEHEQTRTLQTRVVLKEAVKELHVIQLVLHSMERRAAKEKGATPMAAR